MRGRLAVGGSIFLAMLLVSSSPLAEEPGSQEEAQFLQIDDARLRIKVDRTMGLVPLKVKISGDLRGEYVWHYESGQVREKGAYRDGEREGPFVDYHENGQVYLRGAHRKGLLEGPVRLYSETGSLLAEGRLVQDRIQGSWLCYIGSGEPPKPRADCAGRIFVDCACGP